MTRAPLAAALAPAVLAGAAIGHATAGPPGTGPALVTVGARGAGVATGFTVGSGRVVTVAHVLPAGRVTVRGDDGIARRATVIRRDAALDLAVLAVPGLRGSPAPPLAGTRLLVRRDGEARPLRTRVLRRVTARVRTAGAPGTVRRPALELAASPAPGDSGAPVLEGARVTGVLFARSRERAGLAYAVDASALAGLLR